MSSTYILINKADNVIVTLKDYEKGETLTFEDKDITLKEDVPAGHKVATETIKKDLDIMKYGFPIGHAEEEIEVGQWVHTHNTKTNLSGTLEYAFSPDEPSQTTASQERTFKGYVRANGEVGIRNEIWVINTVGCINKTAELLAKTADKQFHGEGIDGVYHYPHPFGCSQLGDDLHNTQKILSNLVHHPNAAGILVLGLGCENNHIAEFQKVIADFDENRVKFLGVQEADDELDEGLELLDELVSFAQTFEREEVPVSEFK